MKKLLLALSILAGALSARATYGSAPLDVSVYDTNSDGIIDYVGLWPQQSNWVVNRTNHYGAVNPNGYGATNFPNATFSNGPATKFQLEQATNRLNPIRQGSFKTNITLTGATLGEVYCAAANVTVASNGKVWMAFQMAFSNTAATNFTINITGINFATNAGFFQSLSASVVPVIGVWASATADPAANTIQVYASGDASYFSIGGVVQLSNLPNSTFTGF